jgi:hypothetical protein
MSYIITQKEVITRKEQKCFGCARKFPRNTKMLRETVKDDVIFTAYLCPTCQKVSYERSGDDFCEGDLYELAVEAEQIEKGGEE